LIRFYLILIGLFCFTLMRANISLDSLSASFEIAAQNSYTTNDEIFEAGANIVAHMSSDSILMLFENIPNTPSKGFALAYVGFYQLEFNAKQAMTFIMEAERIAEKINDPKLWYWVYRQKAFVTKSLGGLDDALRYFNLSNGAAISINFDRGRVINLIHLSEIHTELDNQEQAFEYAYLNLKIREDLVPEFGLGYAYYYLGDLFQTIENQQEALKYYVKAEEVYWLVRDTVYAGLMLENQADALINQQLPDSALIIAKQAEEVLKHFPNQRYFQARIEQKIGDVFLEKKDYKLAAQNYKLALALTEDLPFHDVNNNNLQQLGHTYLALEDYTQSEQYYKTYLSVLLANDSPLSLSNAYNNLANLFLKKGNFEKAKAHAGLAIEKAKTFKQEGDHLKALRYLLDANHGLKEYQKMYTVQQQITDLSTRIQSKLERRNATNIKLNYQVKEQQETLNERAQLAIKEQTLNRWIYGIIAFGMTIISLLFLQIIRINKRRNKILGEKNIEIASLNQNLEKKVIERTRELQEKSQLMNNYFDNLPGVGYRINCTAEYIPIFVSKGCYDFYGVSPQEIIHNNEIYINLIHPDYTKEVQQASFDFIKRNETGKVLEQVYPIVVNGHRKWVLDRSTLLLEANGQKYLDGILLDITDQMDAEDALKINQQELSLIYNNTEDLMGMINMSTTDNMTLESINQPYIDFLTRKNIITPGQNITGISLEKYFSDLLTMPPESIANRIGLLKEVKKNKQSIRYETSIPLYEKDADTFKITLTPVIEQGVEICSRIIFVLHDITKEKKAETLLETSRLEIQKQLIFNKKILSSTQDGYILITPDAKIVDVNSRYCELSGYSKAELLNMELNDIDHRFPKAELKVLLQQIIEQGRDRFEVKHTRKDGTFIELDVSIGVLEVDNQAMIAAFYRDISARRKALNELRFRSDFESLLSKISTQFINIAIEDVDQEIVTSLKQICRFANLDHSFIILLDQKNERPHINYEWHDSKFKSHKAFYENSSLTDLSWNLNQLEKNESIFINDPEDLPVEAAPLKNHLQENKLLCFINIPLFRQKELIGFIGFNSTRAIRTEANDLINLLRLSAEIINNVLQRKSGAFALQKSEKRLSTIYNASQDLIGLIQLSEDGTFLIESINQPTQELFKKINTIKDIDSVLGKSLHWLFSTFYGFSEQEVNFRLENIQKVFDEKITFKYESLFNPPGSSLFLYFETTFSPILDAEGNCIQALYAARDITEKKLANDKVIESEKQLSMTFNGSRDVLFIFNLEADGRLLFSKANDTFRLRVKEFIPNLNIEDFYGRDAHYFLEHFMGQPKAEIERRLAIAQNAIEERNPIEYEETFISPDGQKYLSEVTVTPIFNDEGVCEKLYYVSRNITQKVLAQQALALSEQRLSTIYNSSMDVIGLIKLTDEGTHEIESVNKTSIDLLNKVGLNFSYENFEGLSTEVLFRKIFGLTPDLVEERLAMMDEVFLKNKSFKYKTPFAPLGTDIYRDFETVVSPILNDEGKCTHALYTARDITENEIAKNRLVSSQKRLTSIFNGSSDQMSIFDIHPDGELVLEDFNESFKKSWVANGFKLDLEDIYGKTIRFYLKEIMLFSEQEAMIRYQLCQQIIKNKKSHNYEEPFSSPNGKKYILDITISPILDEDDVCRKLLFVLRDVTLKHKAKDRMISKILETEDRERSRFAKELHDSLGQNLTVASLNLNFVKKSLHQLSPDAQQKFKAGFSFLKEAIQESRNIAHNLMPQAISDFGYILAIESLLENLSQSTDITFTFYDNLQGKRLSPDYALSLYRVTQEAINNILKHANATEVTIQLMKHASSIILTIEDNGKGLDINKNLNSFGLNSMRNRASALSGVLDIDGAPGKGTSITLEIPV